MTDVELMGPETWQAIVGICIGVGLAASCGFRVFVPMLILGGAARAEMLTLGEGFSWIESWPALTAFTVATGLEVGAYYVPWLDNLLDTIATPAAAIAGTIVTAACVVDMDPLMQWSLAAIAGGGSALVVQAGTAGLRVSSTLFTGGIGNPIVSTAELVCSLVLSTVSLMLPVLAAAVVLVLLAVLLRFAYRFFTRRRRPQLDMKTAA